MNINDLMLDPKFDLKKYIENKNKEIERLNKLRNEDNEKAAKIILKMLKEIYRLNKIIDKFKKRGK